MHSFNYSSSEPTSTNEVTTTFNVPVSKGFERDLIINPGTLGYSDTLKPVVRLHAVVSVPSYGDPRITVVTTGRGVIVQVEGLHAMLDVLLGGNFLAVECTSPLVTDNALPSLPASFAATIPNTIVYEIVMPIGDKHTLQKLGYTGTMTKFSITHIGAHITGASINIDYLPVVQALTTMVRVREKARTMVPELLEQYDTLMPSEAVANISECPLVKTVFPYVDFGTACGTMESHLLMFKPTTVVGIAKKNTRRRLIISYSEIKLLSYCVPEVPNHILPHMQIGKFTKLAANWRIYPSCHRAGICMDSSKYNLAEYEI